MLITRRAMLAGIAAFIWAPPIRAGEPRRALVMYRRAGCPWCKAWDRDIGEIYPRTDVGQLFPLREVDLQSEGDGGIELARPVRYTPTFVLIEDERELARIEGYPGEDFFWARLELLADEHVSNTNGDSPEEQPDTQNLEEEPHG
jgi:thioredoxin-related protein